MILYTPLSCGSLCYCLLRNTGARNAITISRLNKTVERIHYTPILLDNSVLYQSRLLGTLTLNKHLLLLLFNCSDGYLVKEDNGPISHRRFWWPGKEHLASITFFSNNGFHRSVSRNCWYTVGSYFHGTSLHVLKETYFEGICFTN